MTNDQTLEKLKQMRLHGMVQSLESLNHNQNHQDLSFSERLTLLVDHEWVYRENRKIKRLLQGGQFKERRACLESLDYRSDRGLKKSRVMELTHHRWIKEHQNILITGPAGAGKSYLGQALDNDAALHLFGGGIIAETILDRILPQAHRF